MKYAIGLCILLIGLNASLMAQDIVKDGDGYRTTIKHEYQVQPGGSLQLKAASGDVAVSSWNQNVVKIDEVLFMEVITAEEARQIVARSQANYSQSGNVITLDAQKGKRWIKRNFVIQLPLQFNVDLETQGGDVTVTALTGTVKIATSGGDVDVKAIKGEVSVKTSGGDLLLHDIDGALTAKTSGGDVDLRNLTGPVEILTSGGDIQILNATQNIDLKTSGGDIEIQKAQGAVKAYTSGGTIRVVECQGPTTMHTSGGDLILENVTGAVDARTSGGDIQGHNLAEALVLHTSGGDIELKDVRAAVDASTSGGDVVLEITLNDFTKKCDLTLKTSAGDIELTLPAKFPANIKAEIFLGQGDRAQRRNDIFSDFPLSKNMVTEDNQQILRSLGEINGGGNNINLKTSAGNIRIQKGDK